MRKNRFVKKENQFNMKIAIQFVIIVVLLVVSVNFSTYLKGENKSQIKQSLENLIVKSVTHCYATQGFYPESIEYLKENYGLDYDSEEFSVVYIAFASNIYPQITVVSK
ncbi:MAG: hypothetical protein ACRC7V_04695 [Lachnospiraceae bacterium]